MFCIQLCYVSIDLHLPLKMAAFINTSLSVIEVMTFG